VLWDVDYTLLSAGGLGNSLYEAVFKELFGRELTAIAPKAGRTDRAILLETLALAGLAEPRAHVDDFLALLGQHAAAMDGSAHAYVRALPGAAAAITALASAGTRQSVLTGNVRPLAAAKLAAAGLGEHLDLDIGAYGGMHEVRAELVPVARRAARAAYGADFSGHSTVLIGDTPLDVAAALQTGARVVGVATGSFPAAELVTAGAHTVLPDLTDTSRVLAAVTGSPRPLHGDLYEGESPPDGAARCARPRPAVPAVNLEHPRDLQRGFAEGAGGGRGGGGGGQSSGRGISGLVRRVGSTWRAERIRDWMSSLTSQTLTFMPAMTAPALSQNAMNSSESRSPRKRTWS
jgi:phosphoglycolate phosphatase